MIQNIAELSKELPISSNNREYTQFITITSECLDQNQFQKKKTYYRQKKIGGEERMRLRTNESVEIDDRYNSFLNQSRNILRNFDQRSNKKSVSIRKIIKSDELERAQTEHQYLLLKEQYQLKIESLIKQYELKLAKQDDFFKLREWKLQEEIVNLQDQIDFYQESKNKNKFNHKNSEQNACADCSNGEVIKHLSKVISQIEQNHKNCIQNKKIMIVEAEEKKAKIATLEEEFEKNYQEIKVYKKQIRKMRLQINQLNEEKSQMEKKLNDKQNRWTEKQSQYESLLTKLKRQIQICQKQLEMIKSKEERQSEYSQNNSISSSKIILGNTETNLKNIYCKTNFLKQDTFLKPKKSLAATFENFQKGNQSSKQYYRKMSQNNKKDQQNMYLNFKKDPTNFRYL